jgi:hypothetical protein
MPAKDVKAYVKRHKNDACVNAASPFPEGYCVRNRPANTDAAAAPVRAR